MWNAIQKCSALGCESIDLGRSDMHHTGLNQFKMGWNPKEFTIHYYKYSFPGNKFVRPERMNARFWNNIFSKMPMPILKTIGCLSYRHMG
jgi:lipid II:glycine glycyltransferase (peptidoglycan interpeptide bridge formation enzyme)